MSAVRTDGLFPAPLRQLVEENNSRGRLSATLVHKKLKPWEGILRFKTIFQEDEVHIKEFRGESPEELMDKAVEFLRRRERDDIRKVTLDGVSFVRDVW